MNTEPKPEQTFDDWWQAVSAIFGKMPEKESWRRWYETHQGAYTFASSGTTVEHRSKLVINYTLSRTTRTPGM